MAPSNRQFLNHAIADYNAICGTSFGVDVKGFDAKYLNKLWVDKDLKMHGPLQAFSRTDRTLDKARAFGDIVYFRDLRARVKESIGLFGDEKVNGVVNMPPYAKILATYTGKLDKTATLLGKDPTLMSEKNQRSFIKLFGAILKNRNLLSCFDQFAHDDPLEICTYRTGRASTSTSRTG